MVDTVLATISAGSGNITNGGLTFTDTAGGNYSTCLVNNAASGKQTFEVSALRYFIQYGYLVALIGTSDTNTNSGSSAGYSVAIQYLDSYSSFICVFQKNGVVTDYILDSSVPLPGSDNADIVTFTIDIDRTNKTFLVRANGTDLFGGVNPVGNVLGAGDSLSSIIDASPDGLFYPGITAGSGAYGSVKFSDLTYAPKSGYSEYDSASAPSGEGVGSVSGTSTVSGVGATIGTISAVGSSTGLSTVSGVGSHSGTQFIGYGSGTTTATIPTHAVGDILVAYAYRDGSTTLPTLPAGWTSITTQTGTSCCARLAYKVATATNDSSGTWTSASELIIHVYRADTNYSIDIGAFASTSGTTNTLTYPAVTLQDNGGKSIIAAFIGHRSTNTTIESPPTGMINRSQQLNATAEAAGHDTDNGVTSWSSTNKTITGTASGWVSALVEIKATPTIIIVNGVGSSSPRSQYYNKTDSSTSSNVTSWSSITSSYDGSKIFATNNNSTYFRKSLDYGQTWSETNLSLSESDVKIYCITSNRSGSRLFIIAATSGDSTVHTYMSVDYGATWTLQSTNNNLSHASAIVSSKNSSRLATSIYGGYIYTSNDYGVTWTSQTNAGSKNWIINCLAMSEDGSTLIASPDNSGMYIYLSTDYGVTWTSKTSVGSHYWTSLSMSADATKMFAVNWDDGDKVYVSTDSGSTWSSKDVNATGNNITGGYVSRDGSKFFAVDQITNMTSYSIDNGNTWTEIKTGDNTLSSVLVDFAASYDGKYVYQTMVPEISSCIRQFDYNQIGAFGIAQHPFGWNFSGALSSGFIIDSINPKIGISS